MSYSQQRNHSGSDRDSSWRTFNPSSYRRQDSYRSYHESSDDCYDYPSSNNRGSPYPDSQRTPAPVTPPVMPPVASPVASPVAPPVVPPGPRPDNGQTMITYRQRKSYQCDDDCDNSWVWFIVAVIIFIIIVAIILAIAQRATGIGMNHNMSMGHSYM